MRYRLYEKKYTRDNGLQVFEIWYENETDKNRKWFDWVIEGFILDSTSGVTDVYYDFKNDWESYSRVVLEKLKEKGSFEKIMHWYEKELEYIIEIWDKGRAFRNLSDLIKFFDLCSEAWSGFNFADAIPNIPGMQNSQVKLALKSRRKTACFFDRTDEIFTRSLKKFYPVLGNLVRYISINELRNRNIPSDNILKKRQNHFIFFKGIIYTDISLVEFVKENGFSVKVDIFDAKIDDIIGVCAMKGKAIGKVKILIQKDKINLFRKDEIIVAPMTTPDYLFAMKKAAAIITDEGGITSHAAIVAREFKKPCIIGTKIATKVLKDGDLVEVDANRGIVKILKRR